MDTNENEEKRAGADGKYVDKDDGTSRRYSDAKYFDKDDATGRREGGMDREDGDSRREAANVLDVGQRETGRVLDMGRSWNRAEERMERQRSGKKFKTESPRKMRSGNQDRDLRSKLKKSLKCHNLNDPSDSVTFTKPSNKEEYETDSVVLGRRDKQIQYGKNTIDYDTYCRMIPKDQRKPNMPRTPIKHGKYSRRQWDGIIKNWKQMIHTEAAKCSENNDMVNMEMINTTDVARCSENNDNIEMIHTDVARCNENNDNLEMIHTTEARCSENNDMEMIHMEGAKCSENDDMEMINTTDVAKCDKNNDMVNMEEEGDEGEPVMSWADEVEEMMEDRRRRLVDDGEDWRTASTSTDQGLGSSYMSPASSFASLDME